jgi:aspartate-semialdehyde dehydrogenase
MSYTVGIVGATGAVGKEIRQCLEKSDFPGEKLRIFGSSRSAGSTIRSETFGDITVELFGVDAARECDVVFLAVSGDFALEHAEAISAGDDGAVVIDNSVSFCVLFVCLLFLAAVCLLIVTISSSLLLTYSLILPNIHVHTVLLLLY